MERGKETLYKPKSLKSINGLYSNEDIESYTEVLRKELYSEICSIFKANSGNVENFIENGINKTKIISKSCPFCECRTIGISSNKGCSDWVVFCHGCNTSMKVYGFDTKIKAIIYWNRKELIT